MNPDINNEFRPTLEDDPPAFLDRVNTPWDRVPDFEDYNRHAYRRIVRALKRLSSGGSDRTDSNSQGILILGEAGTGKTHLLMRVARNLSESNHILFIRKPNNEEAVAQHVWSNIVSSLARTLPSATNTRSQLDDLLAHVFSKVLIPEFEQDVREAKDADQKRRWIKRLREDPYNLFGMLGEGERRQDNMDRIRRRTLRFLQSNHPDVDQTIARVLITYCFVAREDRKRLLLTWLAGQDVDEGDAKTLGLPSSWLTLNEDSSEVATSQQREEQALRAIRTIGILSTYYQPLILAFDQLEGLRDHPRLTSRWGDVVREIFTMTPNFLVITCIFPSLWETWFNPNLDQSVSERIAQQTVPLESFEPHHGLKMLATHLEPSFTKHRLPTNIFPFTEDDVERLCSRSISPRTFIQAVHNDFQSWLDGTPVNTVEPSDHLPKIITQEEIERAIAISFEGFENSLRQSFQSEIILEQDFFGRLCNLVETILRVDGEEIRLGKAICDPYVMPPNVIVRQPSIGASICIAVMNSEGNAFAARMRNLTKCVKKGGQFEHLLMIRDRRCKKLGTMSQAHLDKALAAGAIFVHAGLDEVTCLNAMYETLVAVEEHDLTVGNHEIDKRQLVSFFRSSGILSRTELFRHASKHFTLAGESKELHPSSPAPNHQLQENIPTASGALDTPTVSQSNPRSESKAIADFLIGDDVLESPHIGVLGELKDGRRKLAISLTKPQCLVLLGYMGSGKSYALGVLIESALLRQEGLIEQSRPMTVVAFNFRRNPEARFEHGGFAEPNRAEAEVSRLAEKYGAQPAPVEIVNVFGYKEELSRRETEYGDLKTFAIKFKPDELGAEHWEILMKPPTGEAEYMDIIRDIIQKLYYQERLTFENLERAIQTDERMSNTQRRRAMNRMSFAERWMTAEREYEWAEVLEEGSLNIFDLRMQTMKSSEALKLCLIITDLVRRTKNGVNKVIVFDEAHEYVDCKELVKELENSITQIRHDGLSFVLASQFPERIPRCIFQYLLTRLIFKLPNAKAINYVRHAAPNLEGLSPQRVANLDLEQGLCFIQTDDDCTDEMLRVPQQLEVRPRCTMHGGSTVRQAAAPEKTPDSKSDSIQEFEFEELEAELCPKCGEELVFRRTKSAALMVCSSYPDCKYSRKAE